LSLGGFDPPPPVRIRPEMLPLHYNDLFYMCPLTAHSLHCVIYHWVVSINRPSGYEPDALPLRHNDGLSLGGFDPPPPTFCRLARFHYASMTFTSSCGFDPHPPTFVGTLPLRFNDFVLCAPPSHIFVIDFTMS
jgi:hypothetical protein